jgi:hypothetical protein
MITAAPACVCNRRSMLTAQQVSVTCKAPTDGPKPKPTTRLGCQPSHGWDANLLLAGFRKSCLGNLVEVRRSDKPKNAGLL